MLLVQSAHDLQAAITVAVQELEAGPARDRFLVEIVQRWGQTKVPAAAAFVSGLRGAVAVDAASNLAAAWRATDKLTASNWIQSMPEGTARDAALLVQSSWTH